MKIISDVFPSHVSVVPEGMYADVSELIAYPAPKGAGYVSTARCIITDEVVVIAQDSPNGAQIVFQEAYVDYRVEESTHRVVTKSGKMLAFTKDTNCGCGSRLRSWNPYRTIQSIKDINVD